MSDNICETARHNEMPANCANKRHNRCATCDRCYTCNASEIPVTRLEEKS